MGRYLILLSLVLVFFSCDKNKKKTSEADFSKGDLLKNLADSVIIPGYENLASNLIDFENAHQNFVSQPSVNELEVVRSCWKKLYLTWNTVSMFDFGPAKDVSLQGALGTFPTDTAQIVANIQNGSYNLETASNLKAIGIPAFDFLLYRSKALDDYSNNSDYQNYIGELITKMKGEVSIVLTSWKNSYRSTFIASTGTESSSAFSLLINSFVKNYEDAKWAKLGIPLGKQTLDYIQPQYIEARYSKISFDLIKSNLEALKNVYLGGNGTGFDDYLKALNRSTLSSSITLAFNDLIDQIDGYSSDFETMLTSDVVALNKLFTDIQNLTVSMKTDMTSAFGVLITYQDNDGD